MDSHSGGIDFGNPCNIYSKESVSLTNNHIVIVLVKVKDERLEKQDLKSNRSNGHKE